MQAKKGVLPEKLVSGLKEELYALRIVTDTIMDYINRRYYAAAPDTLVPSKDEIEIVIGTLTATGVSACGSDDL